MSTGETMAMSPLDRDRLRDGILRTLERRAGTSPTPTTIADAAVSTFQHVAARLSPVIGDRGVEVLFGRALHLSGSSFSWLAADDGYGVGIAAPAALKARLAAQQTGAAAAASVTILVTFGEVVASLVGWPLAERLLAPVWATSTRLESSA